jgi:CheY-like chemotaxis protein
MPAEASKRKQLLFVDDDSQFLGVLKELLLALSGGGWEIFTAENHGQALEILQNQRMDLVVLDVSMPVMDGIQFLKLLGRAHPGQQVVMLTGVATEESRRASMDGGAVLFLEKPTSKDGYAEIYSALNALAESAPQTGFRGMMRRVGLQEVLQLECLGRKSSILEVFTGKVRGQIYICDGSIVHSECGIQSGEMALYGLLALKRGEFNLLQYVEPPERSISGQWEFLLMEAARLSDEAAESGAGASEGTPPTFTQASTSGQPAEMPTLPDTPIFQKATPASAPVPTETLPEGTRAQKTPGLSSGAMQASPSPISPQNLPSAPAPIPALEAYVQPPGGPSHVRVEEIVLCSGAGEVLYDWQCKSVNARLQLLKQLELHASQLTNVISAGRFNRLELQTEEGRIACGVQFDMRVFVKTSTTRKAAS